MLHASLIVLGLVVVWFGLRYSYHLLTRKSMTIYLAGPVTGRVRQDAENQFGEAAWRLKGMGFEVVNPLEHVADGVEWDVAMERCKELLFGCQSVFLLDGWRGSKGARLEFEWARELSEDVYEEESGGYDRLKQLQDCGVI